MQAGEKAATRALPPFCPPQRYITPAGRASVCPYFADKKAACTMEQTA